MGVEVTDIRAPLLTTEGSEASEAMGMNVAKVPTPKALLASVDRKNQPVDVVLPLIVLEGFLMFI